MLIKDKTAEIKTQWQRADRPARHGTQAGGRTLKGIAISHKENSGPIFRYVYADTQKELTGKLRQHIDLYQGGGPDRGRAG